MTICTKLSKDQVTKWEAPELASSDCWMCCRWSSPSHSSIPAETTSWTTESSVRWSGRGRRMRGKIDFQLCEDWSLIIIHNFLINLLWSPHFHNYYHQTVFLKAFSLCTIYFDNCKFRSWVCYISNKKVLFDKQKCFYAKSRNFVSFKSTNLSILPPFKIKY